MGSISYFVKEWILLLCIFCGSFQQIYYFLKSKAEVKQVFISFKSLVDNQFNVKIKMLQSDWGGEYQGLTSYLRDCGIHHRVSCPYTPQQNGLVERKHRHIVEMGLALLAQAGNASIFLG